MALDTGGHEARTVITAMLHPFPPLSASIDPDSHSLCPSILPLTVSAALAAAPWSAEDAIIEDLSCACQSGVVCEL